MARKKKDEDPGEFVKETVTETRTITGRVPANVVMQLVADYLRENHGLDVKASDLDAEIETADWDYDVHLLSGVTYRSETTTKREA